MKYKRWNSFSATNASEREQKLTCINLNIPMACPPRGTVPVNAGAWFARLLHLSTPGSLSVRDATAPAMSAQTITLDQDEYTDFPVPVLHPDNSRATGRECVPAEIRREQNARSQPTSSRKFPSVVYSSKRQVRRGAWRGQDHVGAEMTNDHSSWPSRPSWFKPFFCNLIRAAVSFLQRGSPPPPPWRGRRSGSFLPISGHWSAGHSCPL
jgi:hypothetical protein